MATYESLIKITGSVGDLVFYTLNGKNVVRKKSGFNKNAFKKSPSYEKVRQNSSEFGHCSKIGKIIRQALDPHIKAAQDPLLYQSFAKLMTEIKDLDSISGRGQRNVKNGIITEGGKKRLTQFQFGKVANWEDAVSVQLGLWENTLQSDKGFKGDEIIILSLKVDFDLYSTEHFQQKISLQQPIQNIPFEKHFSDDDLVFYFVVLQNEGQIVNMGFI